jgi:hypothetical protein
MPTISGTVLDDAGDPVAGRVVRAYRRDTGVLLGETSTSAGEAVDPDYSSVSLLLHMDGANGSTTFTDSSATPKTLTRFGNTQISTAQSQFGGASAYFDGTGDYLTVPYTTAAFDWWTGDCTIECWVYASSFATWHWTDGINLPSLIGNLSVSSMTDYWSFGVVSGNFIKFHYFTGSSRQVTSTNTVTVDQWNHIAMTKSGTTIRLFVNGVEGASATVTGTPQSSTSVPLAIGQSNNRSITGYVDELRITKGVARYTANFTPPDAPFYPSGLDVLPLGEYEIDTAHTGEVNVVCLDDSGGTTYNDLILRTTPV